VGVFHERVLPHASVLVNCMYWDRRYPRLVTMKQVGGGTFMRWVCSNGVFGEGGVA
jgi:hypothetical protein